MQGQDEGRDEAAEAADDGGHQAVPDEFQSSLHAREAGGGFHRPHRRLCHDADHSLDGPDLVALLLTGAQGRPVALLLPLSSAGSLHLLTGPPGSSVQRVEVGVGRKVQLRQATVGAAPRDAGDSGPVGLRDSHLSILLGLRGAEQAEEVAADGPLQNGVEQEIHGQVLQGVNRHHALREQGGAYDLEQGDRHARGVREGHGANAGLVEVLWAGRDDRHELAQSHAAGDHEQGHDQQDVALLDELAEGHVGGPRPDIQRAREEQQGHQ
mmetsp:Transcript_62247/g.163458  ORF Transcript_62247/g.163458 Transcript_62247/m.163458 type:complete len:268 (-) Transcript_62247:112-915(-)